MKIGAQLQMAIENMDKQVELAKKVGSEAIIDPEKVAKEASIAKREAAASGALGNNVNTKA